MGSEWLKFGKHLPGPFFTQWGSYEALKRRERSCGANPQITAWLPHSGPPRDTARIRLHWEAFKSTGRSWHSPRSQQPPESREEREEERGEGKSQRRPGEGGFGVQGEGAWLRVADVPRGPEETWGHNGSREEKKHLSLTFRLELKMEVGLGINSLWKMSTWGVMLATVT